MRAEAIILMYHDLSPRRGEASAEDVPYVLDPEAFRHNLHAIGSAGLRVTNVGAWVSGRGPGGASGMARARPALILTFDDGDASNHEHALPLLLESQFTATFFVTVGRIGSPGSLSWAQIVELQRAGMEI